MHTATLGHVMQNGKKVFGEWSNAYPFVCNSNHTGCSGYHKR